MKSNNPVADKGRKSIKLCNQTFEELFKKPGQEIKVVSATTNKPGKVPSEHKIAKNITFYSGNGGTTFAL